MATLALRALVGRSGAGVALARAEGPPARARWPLLCDRPHPAPRCVLAAPGDFSGWAQSQGGRACSHALARR
eukprot:15417595-Alexandrium_andersonii.AAC.1